MYFEFQVEHTKEESPLSSQVKSATKNSRQSTSFALDATTCTPLQGFTDTNPLPVDQNVTKVKESTTAGFKSVKVQESSTVAQPLSPRKDVETVNVPAKTTSRRTRSRTNLVGE